MLIAKAPLRISFAGGGTDIEPYCSMYGGCVLSAAIDKWANAAIYNSQIKRFIGKYLEPMNGIEKTIASHFKVEGRLSISSPVPPMSGLGSSAAQFVAGIKACAPELSNDEVARLAYYLERRVLKVAGGKQDQYISAYGGFCYIEFGANDRVCIEALTPPPELEELLILIYTGDRVISGHDIIRDQMNRDNKHRFNTMKGIANDMRWCIRHNDLKLFGELLRQAWQIKKELSPHISTQRIDKLYADALANGAIGGKLTGAGGGGYLLLMEDIQYKGQLRQWLASKHIDFEPVKFTNRGVYCESSHLLSSV